METRTRKLDMQVSQLQHSNTITKAVINALLELDVILNPIEECKYPVQKITFLNRWGALQDLFFHKKNLQTA